MCTYIAIINSLVVGSSLLQARFNYTIDEAGMIFSMPYIIAAAVSVPVGWFVSKFGYRMTVTLIGSMIMLAAHVIQISISDCDKCWYTFVPLILLGIAYSTYAVVLWGSIPYMVEARTLGTAFGICTVFQNFATLIAPPILGYI
jgi:MFS family permease